MRPLRLGFSTPRRDCRVAFGRFSRPVDCDDFDTLCGSGRSGVLPFLHRADLRLRSSVSLLRSGAFGSAVVQESAANFSVTCFTSNPWSCVLRFWCRFLVNADGIGLKGGRGFLPLLRCLGEVGREVGDGMVLGCSCSVVV